MKKLLLILCFVTLNVNLAIADLISTFDTDTQNWRVGSDGVISWASSGGNPNGYLRGDDKGKGYCWYFVTPVEWAGDWRNYASLEFDLKIISDPYSYDGEAHEIII